MLKSAVQNLERMPLLFGMPEPYTNERPANYADRVGQWYSASISSTYKKQFGQYFTPVEVADFMASLLSSRNKATHLIDPGAGTGVLACAACEYLISSKKKPSRLTLDVYEIDPNLAAILEKTISYLAEYLAKQDVVFEYTLHVEDFVLKYAYALEKSPTLFDAEESEPRFDICISNPPYFKLPKSDVRAQAARRVVHGQPNIYALFMAISASLLSENGQLVFITPRSFASGPYFQLFREHFFEIVKPEFIHIFDSRRDAFERDSVLQENIILKACRKKSRSLDSEQSVMVSVSTGTKDIMQAKRKKLPLGVMLDLETREKVLKIPHSDQVETVLDKMAHWTGSLHKYGLEISTGPVVAFRAIEFMSEKPDSKKIYAPLLWLQNVHSMNVVWPTGARQKPQYIEMSPESMYLLVPNTDKNYILLRRFSAKEEARRLVAAPLTCKMLPYEWLGLENHLNYIYRPKGTLSEEEAWGLAVLYNSFFLDTYFRMVNGSTQVSATEIRSIPLPPLDIITAIGKRAMTCANMYENIDSLANLAFKNTHANIRDVYV